MPTPYFDVRYASKSAIRTGEMAVSRPAGIADTGDLINADTSVRAMVVWAPPACRSVIDSGDVPFPPEQLAKSMPARAINSRAIWIGCVVFVVDEKGRNAACSTSTFPRECAYPQIENWP